MIDGLTLETRAGLPEALRVLLDEIPRETWEAHPEFGGMVQFWLERHLMFRQLLGQLRADAEDAIDRRIDLQGYGPRLSRFGGVFLNQLHGHHQIEDAHYFPQLVTLDRRIEAGFGMLDADHHALHGHLDTFAEGANAVLSRLSDEPAAREAVGDFHALLGGFHQMLDRHLTDEEDLIVPVILKTGFNHG
jgi:hemerythrin-like domain-containing protein